MQTLFIVLSLALAGEPSPARPAPAEPTREVLLSAVGDISLDGPVGRLLKSHGAAAVASGAREALEADLTLGNLECPVTTRGKKLPKTWNFRAPPKNISLIKEAGFDVVTLANNHVFDYGLEGFTDTLDHLKKAKIPFIGAGRDRDEAESVRVFERNGLKVGFVGLTSTHPQEGWARKSRPGVAYSDFGRIPEIVARARKRCDVLVVVFHGGTELAEEPNDIQRSVARAAIDAGADLFLGHHPHVLQAVELYRGRPIVYSLGNFFFVSPNPATRATVVARATLGPEGVKSIEFVPFDTNWGRPAPAAPEVALAARDALDRLGALTMEPGRFFVTGVGAPTAPEP